MIKRLLIALLVTSTLGISGCGYVANNKESAVGKTMIDLNNMQDWCVGRYTFKLPKDAKMIDEIINYDSFKIDSKTKATRLDFDEAIKEIEKEYNKKDDFIKDQTAIETSKNIITKIIWGHSTFAQGRTPVHVYAFVYDQSTRVFFKITGTYSKKFEKESVNGIKYLVKNLKARDNNTTPTEKGICFKNGFIKDDGREYEFTRQKIGFNFAKAPSVVIIAETEVIYKTEDNLIARTEKNLKRSPNYPKNMSTSKNLKKGNKIANPSTPISGVELVTEIGLEGGTGILATWEHSGTVKSATDPLLSITVDTARTNSYVKTSSVPNQNGLQVYEAILNSIRKF